MKKIIGTILVTAIWGLAFGQDAKTGVNTKDPKQVLHISGTANSTTIADGTATKFLVTPTVRIDGLNQTNNSAHSAAPSSSIQPLYATGNGDLVIGDIRANKILQTLPVSTTAADGLPGTGVVLNATTSVYPVVTATASLRTIPIVLTRTSMVYISASVGIGSIGTAANSTTSVFADSKARMLGLKLQFSAVGTGSGIPVNTPFAASTDSYTTASSGMYIPTGFLWYNVSKELQLPPGTYNLEIMAIGTGNSSGVGSFYATVRGSAIDNVNVIAIAM